MKRTWVWNPSTKQLEERMMARRALVDAPMVHGDFKPVNVGGVVIEDRGHLRRYLSANNLAPYDPGAVQAARARIQRAERAERKQGLISAYERTRDQERAKSRFG